MNTSLMQFTAQTPTATAAASFNVGGNVAGNCVNPWWNGYGYQYYPTYVPNAAQEARIAGLEGEVKVLREMLAALLSGREAARGGGNV